MTARFADVGCCAPPRASVAAATRVKTNDKLIERKPRFIGRLRAVSFTLSYSLEHEPTQRFSRTSSFVIHNDVQAIPYLIRHDRNQTCVIRNVHADDMRPVRERAGIQIHVKSDIRTRSYLRQLRAVIRSR